MIHWRTLPQDLTVIYATQVNEHWPAGDKPRTHAWRQQLWRAPHLVLCCSRSNFFTGRIRIWHPLLYWAVVYRDTVYFRPLSKGAFLSAGCQTKTFNEAKGTITSPGYPYYYTNNLRCTYIIAGTPGATVTLDFVTVRIEFHSNCNYDSLKVGGAVYEKYRTL